MLRAARAHGRDARPGAVRSHGAPWETFAAAASWLERERARGLTPGELEGLKWRVLERLLAALAEGAGLEIRDAVPWVRRVYARVVGAQRRRARVHLVDPDLVGRTPSSSQVHGHGVDESRRAMGPQEFWAFVHEHRDAIRRLLSPRELEVLEHVRDARSIRALAVELGLQPRAVRTLIARIGEKLRRLVPPPPQTEGRPFCACWLSLTPFPARDEMANERVGPQLGCCFSRTLASLCLDPNATECHRRDGSWFSLGRLSLR